MPETPEQIVDRLYEIARYFRSAGRPRDAAAATTGAETIIAMAVRNRDDFLQLLREETPPQQ